MQTVDLANRMSRLGTETAFEVLARARALEATGRSIVHLEIGEPGFDTPPNVVDAAVKALREGHTHYVQSAGIPEARAAIADVFTATRGVPADPDQVVITPGAKPIMFFAILALVGQGDEVVLPDPSFPIYRSMVEFAGGTAVPYVLPIDDDYRLDPAHLEELITPRTKLVIINSPGNPTGSTLPRADLERIAEVIMRHPGCTVLTDEVYRGLSFLDEPPASIAEVDGMMERTIVLDGLSKTYAMTGWRAGWGIMPPAIKPAIERLVVNSVSCTAAFIQYALIEALLGDQSAALRDARRAARAARPLRAAAAGRARVPVPHADRGVLRLRVGGRHRDGRRHGRRPAARRGRHRLPRRERVRRLGPRLRALLLRRGVGGARRRAGPHHPWLLKASPGGGVAGRRIRRELGRIRSSRRTPRSPVHGAMLRSTKSHSPSTFATVST